MNAIRLPAMQMQLVQILWVHSHAHASLGSLAMELTVWILMNAFPVHVIRMQHALTWWDHTHAFATLDTLATGHIVKTSMSASDHHHPAMKMQPVPTMRDHMCALAILVILEMELIVMVNILINKCSVITFMGPV